MTTAAVLEHVNVRTAQACVVLGFDSGQPVLASQRNTCMPLLQATSAAAAAHACVDAHTRAGRGGPVHPHSHWSVLQCSVIGAKAYCCKLYAAASKAVEKLVQHIQRHLGVVACGSRDE